jgi:hypothetical protein
MYQMKIFTEKLSTFTAQMSGDFRQMVATHCPAPTATGLSK